MDGGGRLDSERPARRDRKQTCDLRFRAPDGWRDRDQVLGVRRQRHRAHVRRETLGMTPWRERLACVLRRMASGDARPTSLAKEKWLLERAATLTKLIFVLSRIIDARTGAAHRVHRERP